MATIIPFPARPIHEQKDPSGAPAAPPSQGSVRQLFSVHEAPLPEGVQGTFRPSDQTLWIDPAQCEDFEVTLLHELGHHLLERSGSVWATAASAGGRDCELEDELTRLAEAMVDGLNAIRRRSAGETALADALGLP